MTRPLAGLIGLLLVLGGCGEGILSGGYAEQDGVAPPRGQQHGDGGVNLLWDDAAPPVMDDGLVQGAGADADAGAAATSQVPADCPRGIIKTGGKPAKVRPTPDTSGTPVGTIPYGAFVEVLAVTHGQVIDGKDTWYKVKLGSLKGYVFQTQLKCTTQKPTAFNGFYLPFRCGKKVRVSQGNNTSFSHTGLSKYAFDFSLGVGTPMIAMAKGTVSHVYNKTKPGDPCYNGGGPSCITKANVVWVKHPDGTQTIYAHLSTVKVKLKQKVQRGEVLGKSGSTGYSTGPHAHVGRMKSCCQTIPLKFKDVPGTGVPKTGDYVISGNCY